METYDTYVYPYDNHTEDTRDMRHKLTFAKYLQVIPTV